VTAATARKTRGNTNTTREVNFLRQSQGQAPKAEEPELED